MIYLDNAATTAVTDNVFDAMLPWLKEGYGNASSVYSLGRKSAIALNRARALCAEVLGCEPRSIFFTSGGTESDNHAVFAAAEHARAAGKTHIITSAIEHHAILEPLKALEKQGFRITRLPVYNNGIVRISDLEAAICPDTGFVTIMAANNEIGTIQPVDEAGAICRERGIPFHTDAVQAFGNTPLDVSRYDMLSVSGHKLHAPKGVGLLYVREPAALPPFILGGAQQNGKRAGTENVAGIVGLAEAMRAAAGSAGAKRKKLLALRQRLISGISAIKGARLNGDPERRLASNVNFSFTGIEGEALVLQLDLASIAVSSGSACASGSLDPSHVLTALGLSHDEARSSIRITMSDLTSSADIDGLLEALPPIIDKLRSLRGIEL